MKLAVGCISFIASRDVLFFRPKMSEVNLHKSRQTVTLNLGAYSKVRNAILIKLRHKATSLVSDFEI